MVEVVAAVSSSPGPVPFGTLTLSCQLGVEPGRVIFMPGYGHAKIVRHADNGTVIRMMVGSELRRYWLLTKLRRARYRIRTVVRHWYWAVRVRVFGEPA
jgi:hypothetical protein